MRKHLTLIAAAAGIAAVASCSWIDTKQRQLIFRPSADARQGVANTYGFADLSLPVGSNGEQIHAWWGKAANAADERAAPSVLFLHGARRNLSGSIGRISRLQDMGFNVLAIDYRGFGKSSGDLPSEAAAYEDALAAWDWLKRREPYPARRFIYGYSLGGAVAAELALRTGEARALILESTFTSLKDMAERTAARFLPLSLILTQRFDTLEKIPKLTMPVVIVHGSADKVVPVEMAQRLFEAAPQPKRLLVIDGASHYSAGGRAIGELRRELVSLVCPNAGTATLLC